MPQDGQRTSGRDMERLGVTEGRHGLLGDSWMKQTCLWPLDPQLVKVKAGYVFHLRTTGCHWSMVSHNFTCSPIQASTPALTPAGEGWHSIYLPWRDGRLSWPRCLITPGLGIEPMTARSEVRRPDHCTTETPNVAGQSTRPWTNLKLNDILIPSAVDCLHRIFGLGSGFLAPFVYTVVLVRYSIQLLCIYLFDGCRSQVCE